MNKSITILLSSLLIPTLLPAQDGIKFKFAIETLGGQKLTQDDFKDNLVILDFWGTWCGPCRQAIPGLVDLYKKYKHHGLEIIGLNYKEKGSKEEVLSHVRGFAAEHDITYTLAIGTAEIRNQVVGFSGYPTMLFFKKGMKFDHLEVGFSPKHLEEMEAWIRSELGLEQNGAEDEAPEGKEKPEKPTKTAKPKIPDDVIYRPGNHDTGFDFKVEGLDGKEIEFSDFRGKMVIVVLTSTWDHEAANTAGVLNELQDKYAKKGVAILAASLEMKKDRDGRVEAIKSFAAAHKTTYRILPVGLNFLKKIYEPSGVPLYLVFDEKGTLILRKRNNTKERILKAIEQALGTGD